MCSCRTYVPMIACVLIPGFELRAALRKQPGLALRPAALSPAAGREPLLGPVTAEAERLGVRPGMRLGEALATCPEPRADLGRLRRAVAGLPRAAPARARADGAAPARGAARARREAGGTACRAPGCSRGRTFGAGRPARLGPGERWTGHTCARPPA